MINALWLWLLEVVLYLLAKASDEVTVHAPAIPASPPAFLPPPLLGRMGGCA